MGATVEQWTLSDQDVAVYSRLKSVLKSVFRGPSSWVEENSYQLPYAVPGQGQEGDQPLINIVSSPHFSLKPLSSSSFDKLYAATLPLKYHSSWMERLLEPLLSDKSLDRTLCEWASAVGDMNHSHTLNRTKSLRNCMMRVTPLDTERDRIVEELCCAAYSMWTRHPVHESQSFLLEECDEKWRVTTFLRSPIPWARNGCILKTFTAQRLEPSCLSTSELMTVLVQLRLSVLEIMQAEALVLPISVFILSFTFYSARAIEARLEKPHKIAVAVHEILDDLPEEEDARAKAVRDLLTWTLYVDAMTDPEPEVLAAMADLIIDTSHATADQENVSDTSTTASSPTDVSADTISVSDSNEETDPVTVHVSPKRSGNDETDKKSAAGEDNIAEER
ncbi:hypothetical protein F4777DRAFT_583341 [Nemania sp. FL0916]|nr:hypothetical protein F4777DRAFT_583341 [Nemania sp. FL0916]